MCMVHLTSMANSKDLLCRLCMKSEDVMLFNMFHEDVIARREGPQIPMPMKILQCVDIQVRLDDNLPKYICHRCAYKVDLFYTFKEQCKQANVTLMENKVKKEVQNEHIKEDWQNTEVDIKTEDEPTVILVPTISSEHDIKDPLALSDYENNDLPLSEKKPVHLDQEKATRVQIEDVIREQRENFNKIRKTQKKHAEFLNLENTIKQQRETFKSKDFKSNKSPEVVKEPVKPMSHKTYCRLCHRSIPSEQFAQHSLAHQKKKQLSSSKKKSKRQNYKRITCGGKKMFSCDFCAKTFIMKHTLQRHMQLHQANGILKSKKIHQCPVCNKCYTVSSSLKRHLILHTGQRPFRCPICPRTFSDRSNLTKHQRIHYPVKPYKCALCSAEFQSQNYLKKHLVQHLDDRRKSAIPDHDCYTKKLQPDEQIAMLMSTNVAWRGKDLFSFRADTSSDENETDSDNDVEVISTNTDNAVPSTSQQQEGTQTEVDEYAERESNAVSSWFRCRYCQTICSTYKQLIEHRKVHSGIPGFRCAICNSLFQTQLALTQHIASCHFKCNICDQIFKTKFMCQAHEKEHNVEDRNACGTCGKIFFSIDTLKQHMMMHKLEAPFKCVLCNSEYPSRTLLEMHQKVCCRRMK